jgi:DNA repair exonuclease SbcCD ATPase subunit
MSDDIKLTYDELLQKNLQLRQTITVLRNQQEEYEKCTSRINPPNKTYKDLENKLASLENIHQDKIQELWDNHINPLQNEIKDKKIQLESAYKQDIRNMEEIGHLKKIIDRLNTIVNYAAGYISSCEQFRDKYPNYVKDWLFQGIKQ